MVTMTSNTGVVTKKIFEKMANGLFAVNISCSLAVGVRWKAAKSIFYY